MFSPEEKRLLLSTSVQPKPRPNFGIGSGAWNQNFNFFKIFQKSSIFLMISHFMGEY